MSDIIYTYKNNVYFNITNRCTCKCIFCIRDEKDSLGDADGLWHDHNPSWDEIKKAIDSFDFAEHKEAVFCGYGEPTCAYENLLASAKYMKEKYPDIKLRLIQTDSENSLIRSRLQKKWQNTLTPFPSA